MHRTLRAGAAAVALILICAANAAAAPYASRTLSKGTSGGDVETLQRYLDDAGYETTADGEFGPATARSVRDFEAAEQRTVDGKATRSDQQLLQTRAEEGDTEPAVEDTERQPDIRRDEGHRAAEIAWGDANDREVRRIDPDRATHEPGTEACSGPMFAENAPDNSMGMETLPPSSPMLTRRYRVMISIGPSEM